MAEVQESWREVVSKTEALGHKLKLHLERESDDTEAQDTEAQDTGDVPVADESTEGPSERTSRPAETRAALEDFGHKLQDVFESFGAAAKDPGVRSDVKELGLALKDALLTTLTTVGSEVGDVVKKASGHGGSAGSNEDEDEDEDGGTSAPPDSDEAAGSAAPVEDGSPGEGTEAPDSAGRQE
jgi:hypothetical protein